MDVVWSSLELVVKGKGKGKGGISTESSQDSQPSPQMIKPRTAVKAGVDINELQQKIAARQKKSAWDPNNTPRSKF